MDLLSPCRRCLLCLPFFHDSPPSSPRHAAAAAAPSASSSPEGAANGADPLHRAENSPCPDAVHATQAQAVSPPGVEGKGKAPHQDEGGFGAGMAGKSEGDQWMAAESDVVAPALSGIVIAPPVSANCCAASPPEDVEEIKGAAMSEEALSVPFINDITFAPSGFLPLPSPITPAPFGSGYPAGQYPPHHQIYQGEHQEHEHPHGIQENPHQGEGTGLHHEVGHGHDLAQDHGYEHGPVPEHVGSHHGHRHSHHGHEHAHSEVPLSEQSSDASKGRDELSKGGDSFQHAPHHSHDSATALHGTVYKDDDDDVEDAVPTSSLGVSPSMPELGSEAKVDSKSSSAVSPTNGAPALMESYHSEPVMVLEDIQDDDSKEAAMEALGQHSASHAAARRQRREHFKHQLKGIKQQIRQGGHHIKEEGSKHMQTIMENMNKHTQQLGESRSFSMIPRASKN